MRCWHGRFSTSTNKIGGVTLNKFRDYCLEDSITRQEYEHFEQDTLSCHVVFEQASKNYEHFEQDRSSCHVVFEQASKKYDS